MWFYDALRTGLLGVAVGAVTALVGQAVPPFHVLGHELAQVSSIVAGLVQTGLARQSRRRHPDDLDAALRVALAGLVGLGLGIHGVGVVASAGVHGCDPAGTGLFFWITWVPLGALMTVVGLATARRPPVWVAGIVALMFLATVLHDLARSAAGLYVADPLIGFPLALDQRITMELPARAVLQRGWLLSVAGTAWLVLRATTRGLGLSGFARGALLAVVATTLGWAGQLGMGPGIGPRGVLDGVHQGEHVRLRYDRSGKARQYLTMIEEEAEWSIHRLTEAWGVSRDGLMVSLDIYDSDEALFAATGRTSAHGDYLFAAMVWTDGLDPTMHHEMVHVIDHLAGHPGWIVDLSRARAEGSAEAWTDGYAEEPATHGVVAVAARRGRLPRLSKLLSPVGFWSIEENMAYRASGSFVGFLILRYGVEPWRRWLTTQDLTVAYDKSVDELEAEWRTFLLALEPDARAEETATWAFDPVLHPPATGRQCPKLGFREPPTVDLARAAQRASDHATALGHWRVLYDERPTAYLFWRVVRQLGAMGDHEAVLAELDRVDPTVVGETRVADARIESLAALGRGGPELVAALDARLARRPDGRLAAARRLLDDPVLAGNVPALVLRRSEEHALQQQAEVARLAYAHPEAARDLFGLVSDLEDFPRLTARESRPDAEDLVALVLDRLDAAPDPCEPTPDRWDYIPENLLQMGTCDLAERLLDALDGRCPHPGSHWHVDRLRSRLAWQIARQPEGACARSLSSSASSTPRRSRAVPGSAPR
ncbi:MAG: hypothetical protein AAF211_14950 [Myxococcota bacterium]